MAVRRIDLKNVETHFAFGKNWSDFSKKISPTHIASAVDELKRLSQREHFKNLNFLDIGCGSGIHSLAALQMGAKQILAVDVDQYSVQTTKEVLENFWNQKNWSAEICSVFDLNTERMGTFDVVYSWGVLHHTGAMWEAISRAAQMVRPSGIFILAIYVKNPFCGFWRVFKRFYSSLPSVFQKPFLWIYNILRLLRTTLGGENPIRTYLDYHKNRGMSFSHDSHDWLGGFPYESATQEEISRFMLSKGFRLKANFNTQPPIGILGTGCAEYLFERV